METINLLQTAERLLSANDILILTHRRPDGDTIGSGMGLHYALKQLGKRSRVECADPFPTKFSYLYEEYTPEEFEPQFVVAVDAATIRLLSTLGEHYAERMDLVIDHHKSNTFYGKETLLDVESPATAELIYLVITQMGVTLNKEISNALFTGIVTDTGGLRFQSTTSRTYRVSADLIDGGAEHGEINRLIFENNSKGRMALEAFAIDSLEYYFGDCCALLYLPYGIQEEYHLDEEDLDGISSLPRTIEGIHVAVTIRDLGEETYRVSLRSRHPFDCSVVCAQFGGGGHANAAGCTMVGTVEDVKERLLKAVEEEHGRVTV